jgi:hypothetical protein
MDLLQTALLRCMHTVASQHKYVVPRRQQCMLMLCQLQPMFCVPCLGPSPVLSVCCAQGLDEVVDRVEVLTQLVADGQDNLAQQWAVSLGREYQVHYIPCVPIADAWQDNAQSAEGRISATDATLIRDATLGRQVHLLATT